MRRDSLLSPERTCGCGKVLRHMYWVNSRETWRETTIYPSPGEDCGEFDVIRSPILGIKIVHTKKKRLVDKDSFSFLITMDRSL